MRVCGLRAYGYTISGVRQGLVRVCIDAVRGVRRARVRQGCIESSCRGLCKSDE